MGSRANYWIVEKGQKDLFYAHTGAQHIEQDFFFGPEVAINHIRSLKPADEPLDDVWCEGAAVIDLDESELLLFGGELIWHETDLRNLWLDLLSISWPDWKVCWARYGIVSIGDRLNIPREQILNAKKELAILSLRTLPVVKPDKPGIFSIVSIMESDGSISDFLAATLPENLLSEGPEPFLAYLTRCPSPQNNDQIERATGQVFVDIDKSIVYANLSRFGAVDYATQEALQARWPGWTIHGHNQGLPYHWQLTDRDPKVWERPVDELLQELRSRVSCEKSTLVLPAADRRQRFDAIVERWRSPVQSSCQ
jgi:hypothetical protein